MGLPAATRRPGEGWKAAVRRAGREKLGVELDVGEVLGEGELEREAYTLRMRLYRAAIREGEPEDVDQPAALAPGGLSTPRAGAGRPTFGRPPRGLGFRGLRSLPVRRA